MLFPWMELPQLTQWWLPDWSFTDRRMNINMWSTGLPSPPLVSDSTHLCFDWFTRTFLKWKILSSTVILATARAQRFLQAPVKRLTAVSPSSPVHCRDSSKQWTLFGCFQFAWHNKEPQFNPQKKERKESLSELSERARRENQGRLHYLFFGIFWYFIYLITYLLHYTSADNSWSIWLEGDCAIRCYIYT